MDIINDRKKALEEVKRNGYALQYVSEELRGDKEIVLEAVKNDDSKNYYWIFFNNEDYDRTVHWSETKEKIIDILENGFYDGNGEQQYDYIITDKDLNVIYEEGDYPDIEETEYENVFTVGERIVDLDTKRAYDSWEELEYEKENLNNKEYILNKVRHDGLNLNFASKELKNDKEIVLEAIKQNEYALHYASKELRDDPEVVMEAVKKDGDTLVFAGEKFIEENDEILNKYTGIDIKKCYEDLLEWKKSDSSSQYDEACDEYFRVSYFDKVGNNEDKKKLEKACQEILEKINERKVETHQLSEIEEVVSGRKLSDVNKVTTEIVQANEEKEKEETNETEHDEQ